MPKTRHGPQKKELKANIGDFVGPILKQLVEVKNHKDSLLPRGDIEEICELVEKVKGVLENRKKWDNELMGHFERIQRQIDYDKEDKVKDDEEKVNDNKWIWVKKKFEKLLGNQIEILPLFSSESDNEASDLSQKSITSEIGEPSSNNNHNYDNFIQFDEYINQLNPEHRDCLYTLGIFPENAKLKKRLLLCWWLGLGLSLGENKNITAEQVAETFFCDLVNKGILQPIHTRRHNQVVDCCIINPTIHRQLFSNCKSQKLLIDMKGNEGTLRFYGDDKSKVRVLLNLNDQYLNSDDIIAKKVLSDHTMQAVQFGNWHCSELQVHNMVEGNVSERTKFKDHIEVDKTDFLVKLGKKIAFLSLRNISGIERLPDSIGKLDDLRILDLRACHNLEILPRKRWSKSHKILGFVFRQQKWLKNLTYLDISECFLLDHMPKWVCELSNLEVLKGFVASNAGKEKELCRLGDLSKLKKLRKLGVRITMHLDPLDLSGLKPLESLSVLTLTWGVNKQSGGEQIIMADQAENQYIRSFRGFGGTEIKRQNNGSGKIPIISFPKNLEKLDIRCYPKSEAQELLNPTELQKLKRLYIRGGKLTKIESKPAGWNVEILRLRYLKYLDFNLFHLGNIFTKLKYFEYEHCFNRKYFPRKIFWSVDTDGPFPSDSEEDLDSEVLIDGRVQLTITRNMVSLASQKQKMMLALTGCDSISDRPGLDLVLVLDVTKNMNENFIKELKIAMLFVIKKLRFIDRLSIVTFSNKATVVYPLCQVTKTFRKEAETLVTNLKATNDFDNNWEEAGLEMGLKMGLKIIKDRSNSSGNVAAIMLLTVGDRYISKIEISKVAVHTFYLGAADCEEGVYVANMASGSMGGTFSYVSIAENLIKAFAVCLAGLLTVAAQDLTLTICSIREESTINYVAAGEYPTSTDEADGSVTVKFGDLYSNEVRKILLEIQLPATDKEQDSNVLKISCSYKVNKVLFVAKPTIVTVKRIAEVPADRYETPLVQIEGIRRKLIEFIKKDLQIGYERWDKVRNPEIERAIIDFQKNSEDLVKSEIPFLKDLFQSMWDDLQQMRFYGLKRAFQYSFLSSHGRQRTAVRGVQAENSLIFSTPTMVEFFKQAEKFHADTRVKEIINSNNPSQD